MTVHVDVNVWMDRGRSIGATHLVIVCDTFSYDDYPVFVMPNQHVDTVVANHGKGMQRVHDVYSLA